LLTSCVEMNIALLAIIFVLAHRHSVLISEFSEIIFNCAFAAIESLIDQSTVCYGRAQSSSKQNPRLFLQRFIIGHGVAESGYDEEKHGKTQIGIKAKSNDPPNKPRIRGNMDRDEANQMEV